MTRRAREYLFLRHAEAENQNPAFTAASIVRDDAGRVDYRLSPRGIVQATQAGRNVRDWGAEVVLASSLRRARQTAQIVAREAGLPEPELTPDLDEINPGRDSLSRLSFSSRKNIIVSSALVAAYLLDRRVSARRRGESASAVLERIERVLSKLLRSPARRIVLVGHGYWITTMALMLCPSLLRGLQKARWIHHVSATRVVAGPAGELRCVEYALRVGGT